MRHHTTVFSQLMKLVSRQEFESAAKRHHQGRKLRKMTRWSQWIAMSMAQISGRQSLRDIESNLNAQHNYLYHLGCEKISRSSLSRVNEIQPYTLYEELFSKLYQRCKRMAPKHGFRFKNPLYSMDASILELSLKIFPWADFNKTKGAMKLHVVLNHSGCIPEFASITEGKVSDKAIARVLRFPRGSIVVCDRGYTDFLWLKSLENQGIFFVTRLRKGMVYRVKERRKVDKGSGVISDHEIELTSEQAKREQMPLLRKISYRDPETKKRYVFITNQRSLSSKTIAKIYKARWKIELFFKWIKQNLKIKTFLGTTKNAIMTQIWIALCVCLLLYFLQWLSRTNLTLQQILRLLPLNLFIKKNLIDLLKGKPPDIAACKQLERVWR